MIILKFFILIILFTIKITILYMFIRILNLNNRKKEKLNNIKGDFIISRKKIFFIEEKYFNIEDIYNLRVSSISIRSNKDIVGMNIYFYFNNEKIKIYNKDNSLKIIKGIKKYSSKNYEYLIENSEFKIMILREILETTLEDIDV